jgi:hypothetical protein
VEYVFGTQEDIEVLKIKSDAHTDLTGFQQIERVYPDQTIIDCFRIVRKIDSQEDDEENCYDWYEIDRHYRYSDPVVAVAKTEAIWNEMAAAYQEGVETA